MNILKFETAKLAKDVGFNLKTKNHWSTHDDNGNLNNFLRKTYKSNWNSDFPYISNREEIIYSAPTQSELQQWIWENHALWVQSTPMFSSNEMLWINVTISSWKLPETITVNYIGYDVYEGLEIGLQEALILIKEIKNEK